MRELYCARGTRYSVEGYLGALLGAGPWGMYEVPGEAKLLVMIGKDTPAQCVVDVYNNLPTVLPAGVVFRVLVESPEQIAAVMAAARLGGDAAAVIVLKEFGYGTSIASEDDAG